MKILGSFSVPDVWQSFTNAPVAAPPSARNSHTAVWTGTEMIVWGGYGAAYFNDGGRYNPAVDTWTALPVIPGSTPAARLDHAAVWTGSEMIVWGGIGSTNFFNDGGLYNPVLNTWTYISGTLANAPASRLHHTAIWTGSAMIVWGGAGGAGPLNDGGLYNPGLNSWTALTNSPGNTPAPRQYHTAVWTGGQMIVWGGSGAAGDLNDGGLYDPVAASWTAFPNSLPNTPSARQHHTAVWTGSQMIVWGGSGVAGDLNDGGLYDPVAASWIALPNSLPNAPGARESHTALWTGTQMIVWGGYSATADSLLNDGALYNPVAASWTYISSALANAPSSRYQHTAVWTGNEMVVWGGANGANPLNDGGRYNPSANSWIYLPSAVANTPSPRSGHTAVWTGAEMIVWGGTDGSLFFNDGGRFNPALNTWSYLPNVLSNSLPGRQFHTAVWSGNQMIVWGGVGSLGYFDDGALYSPSLNAWTYLPSTLPNTPPARDGHTAVWTGTEMIVWGGLGLAGALNDGGRFNPASTSWIYLPSTLPGTPPARIQSGRGLDRLSNGRLGRRQQCARLR